MKEYTQVVRNASIPRRATRLLLALALVLLLALALSACGTPSGGSGSQPANTQQSVQQNQSSGGSNSDAQQVQSIDNQVQGTLPSMDNAQNGANSSDAGQDNGNTP